jgi:hypothetical protein
MTHHGGTEDTKINTKGKKQQLLLLPPCALRVLRASVVNQWTISVDSRSH